jgi:hypothetical protein
MSQTIKYLIIPDVHGRTFWKEPVKYVLENTDAKIIFLGDYLDFYKDEFIETYHLDDDNENYWECYDKLRNDTIENFREIINFKKNNADRISLLLGNHDCGYAISKYICESRMDKKNYRIISRLFYDNRELFQLADEAYINDKHFIFSHAGINKKYAEHCFNEEVNEDNVVKLFNKYYQEENYGILDSLGMYSYFRGRYGGRYGSLIWADAREWFVGDEDISLKNEAYGFSVVGHTMLSEPRIDEDFAFLDTMQAFIIDDKGIIYPYNNINKENIYDLD